MKILITEDNFVARKILSNFLQKYGSVDVAADGIETVEAIQYALKKNEPYNLICLDIHMPRMDGFEALCAIRAHEEEAGLTGTQQSKIIITTGLDDTKTVLTSFRRQCDAFLNKPITLEKIEAEMKKLGLT
ncbi:MAG: response regulator [Desulfovibrionaceae bacterium]|nr:response regulator [Desulfovibrionaceae bacterium]